MQKHAAFPSKSQSICGKQEYISAEFGLLPLFLEPADTLFAPAQPIAGVSTGNMQIGDILVTNVRSYSA
jgi:hypothetical protein